MLSKNIRFGALSATREPIPWKCYALHGLDKMLLWWRHQGRRRHYKSIWDSKQGSGIRIQNENRKAGDRRCPQFKQSIPLINASQKWESTVPCLVAPTLVASLQEALWQDALVVAAPKQGSRIRIQKETTMVSRILGCKLINFWHSCDWNFQNSNLFWLDKLRFFKPENFRTLKILKTFFWEIKILQTNSSNEAGGAPFENPN